MKKPFLIFLSVLTIWSFPSCKKEPINKLSGTTWCLIKYKTSENTTFKRHWRRDYELSFTDSTFGLMLDVNGCGGTYQDGGNGLIQFSGLACTEACCDKEEALEIATLFPQFASYTLNGNRLTLNGEAIMEFKLLK